MYTCAHVGILYDFNSNRQHILQGHVSLQYFLNDMYPVNMVSTDHDES